MGGTTWSASTYDSIKRDYSTKSADKIFTSKSTDNLMDPKGIKFRESRDSDAHPATQAVMFWLDVTGSMHDIPEQLARHKLGALMNTLIAHGLPDAQVFFGGIGDHHSDRAPLQIGQFESGTVELDQWLTKLYLEGGGGGQSQESYLLAWLFAGRHTSIDCYEKRKQKGFLFTAGDEWCHDSLDANSLKQIMGYTESVEVTREQLLAEAQEMYHVFHIHVNQGSYKNAPGILEPWKKLLGERLLICEDYNTIGELVASTVAIVHGADLKTVTSGFDSHTAGLITSALANVERGVAKKDTGGVLAL